MYRLSLLFLFQILLAGKTFSQTSFNHLHEKFIRLHRTADPDELFDMLLNEKKLIPKKGPQPFRVYQSKLALDRGIYFYMIDDYEKSILYFHQAAQLKGLTSNRDKILLYTYLGVSYRDGKGAYKQAHKYFDQAIKLAEKEKDPDLLASAVMKKGTTYYYQDRFAKGVHWMESFMEQRATDISVERQLSFHGFLAQGYDRLGNYKKCYTHLSAAVELAETTKDDEVISDQYHNYTLYFLRKNRNKEAKELVFQSVRRLKNKPGLEEKLYDSYALLGQIYSSLNQSDSALYYATLAHNYALKTKNAESLVVTYATLGHIYNDLKAYPKSLNYLLKSAVIEEQQPGISSQGDIYHNIAVVYLQMKNYRQVLVYLDKSNKRAHLEGDIYTLQLNYHDLGEAYIGLGDFERALEMKDSSLLYYDSMNNMEQQKELLQLEVRFKTKLKEQENEVLKLEIKRQHDLRRDMILFGVILILLLLGIVYILFISNRLKKSKVAEATAQIKNQKLEEELLHQRLHLLTEDINRKNQLIQSLEADANSATEENLLSKVTLENDWLAFMTEFDKIHRGYLAELKHKFPELTTNNLRLAALVKLEFSNKEIANILCITENGVKKAKQRLKERLKEESGSL